MDLLRCTVCGKPLHTPDLGKGLARKLDKEIELLSPSTLFSANEETGTQ